MYNVPRCSFYVCTKYDLSPQCDEQDTRERRAHISSYHTDEKLDVSFEKAVFRFRRLPQNDMMLQCICGSRLTSRQSLHNHVKGSSKAAKKNRNPCTKITKKMKTILNNLSAPGIYDDNEYQAVNAWPADDEEIDRVSETWALVPYELPSDDEDSEQAKRNNVDNDVLQAILAKLSALEQHQIEMNEEMKTLRQKLNEK